jgi:hypothetical protein
MSVVRRSCLSLRAMRSTTVSVVPTARTTETVVLRNRDIALAYLLESRLQRVFSKQDCWRSEPRYYPVVGAMITCFA